MREEIAMVSVVNERDGISIVKYAKEIASVDVEPAGMNRKRMIASVEVERLNFHHSGNPPSETHSLADCNHAQNPSWRTTKNKP